MIKRTSILLMLCFPIVLWAQADSIFSSAKQALEHKDKSTAYALLEYALIADPSHTEAKKQLKSLKKDSDLLWSRAFMGHIAAGNKLAISPNGKYLASAAEDAYTIVWDLKNGESVFLNERSSRFFTGLEFTQDNSNIFVGSFMNRPELFEIHTPKLVHTFDAGVPMMRKADISPDESKVVIPYNDPMAIVWDMQTGEELVRLEHEESVDPAFFSPDGKQILTGSDKQLFLWDANTGEKIHAFEQKHTIGIWAAAVSPDWQYAVTGSFTGELMMWDVKTGKHIRNLEAYSDMVKSITFSADGKYFATASELNDIPEARIYQTKDGKLMHTLKRTQDGGMHKVEFSADGKQLLSLGDGKVVVWDVDGGELAYEIQYGVDALEDAIFSLDAEKVYTFGKDATVREWSEKMPDNPTMSEHWIYKYGVWDHLQEAGVSEDDLLKALDESEDLIAWAIFFQYQGMYEEPKYIEVAKRFAQKAIDAQDMVVYNWLLKVWMAQE